MATNKTCLVVAQDYKTHLAKAEVKIQTIHSTTFPQQLQPIPTINSITTLSIINSTTTTVTHSQALATHLNLVHLASQIIIIHNNKQVSYKQMSETVFKLKRCKTTQYQNIRFKWQETFLEATIMEIIIFKDNNRKIFSISLATATTIIKKVITTFRFDFDFWF